MRKLIILRGAPGSGKSTFIKNQGLSGYTIASDTIRSCLNGITMTEDGLITVNQKNSVKVWKHIENLLSSKMSKGEFVILDATFQKKNSFIMPIKLANKHRYEVMCVDFSKVPIDEAKRRNKCREFYNQVPDTVIDSAYENFKEGIPDEVKLFAHSFFENQSLLDFLDEKIHDLNHYEKIHHIGDIHGCFTPLNLYFKQGLLDNEFYIFVGDYLDRGIENGETIQWFMQNAINRPNVVLLRGNHEQYLHHYSQNCVSASKEFTKSTLPQLKKVNFSQVDADIFCNNLKDCFLYQYGSFQYFITHAGIASIPKHPVLIPSHQYWNGTGGFDSPVDSIFSRNMEHSDWIQIHGHRNPEDFSASAFEKSINLEGKVEYGGNLRILTVNKTGKKQIHEIPNTVYNASSTESDHLTKHPKIVLKEQISHKSLQKLVSHKYVMRKSFETYPHIHSFNFSRKAFQRGIWDKINVTARGLFVDDENYIVARAYNKFFNLEERNETQMRNLKYNLQFPVTISIKENGFLGILGYDKNHDKLFFTTKSSPESPHAEIFKTIFMNTVSREKREEIKAMLNNRKLSMLFEVNDPINDPHIIEYKAPHIVLLDIVYRFEQFERVSDQELRQIANDFQLPLKNQAYVLNTWSEFLMWYRNVEDQGMDYTFDNKKIEGFVVCDQKGFMFKIKLSFYEFWKYLRSIKEFLVNNEGNEFIFDPNLSNQEVTIFYEWLKNQKVDVLNKSIIDVRKIYELESKN